MEIEREKREGDGKRRMLKRRRKQGGGTLKTSEWETVQAILGKLLPTGFDTYYAERMGLTYHSLVSTFCFLKVSLSNF